MNYENDIEEIIMNELSYIYSIKDYNILFRYIYLRYLCIRKSAGVDFGKFILKDELGITTFTYKGIALKFISGFDNSICNIIDNLFFNARMRAVIIDEYDKECDFDEYIKSTIKIIEKHGKNKSKKYKNSPYYSYHLNYHKLIKLNQLFNIKEIQPVRPIDEFIQNNIDCRISYEVECLRYIHASNFHTESVNSISEETVESYIYKHLDELEEGLKPVSRQVVLDEGRIDILAKDKSGKYVILELKVANDKHLIWQVLYYPMAIEPIIKTKDVRIMTLCPNYPKYILEPLKRLRNVEIVEYNPTISNGKILSMDFTKKNVA